jgi:YidC/Oxa1 family membrane protein insertase
MDTKNVVAAISLSAAVIVLYSLFFAPEPVPRSENLAEKDKIEKNSDAPSLEQAENLVKISRDEAIVQNERVSFENNSVKGSISLKGTIIDDLTFKTTIQV